MLKMVVEEEEAADGCSIETAERQRFQSVWVWGKDRESIEEVISQTQQGVEVS